MVISWLECANVVESGTKMPKCSACSSPAEKYVKKSWGKAAL